MAEPELQELRQPDAYVEQAGNTQRVPSSDSLIMRGDPMKRILNRAGISGFVGLTEEESELFHSTLEGSLNSVEERTNGSRVKKNPVIVQREAIRKSYTQALSTLPMDELADRIIKGHRDDDDISGISRLLGDLSSVGALFVDRKMDKKRYVIPTERVDLRTLIPKRKINTQKEGAVRKAIKFFEERGETDNLSIFSKYFVNKEPSVSIARELEVDESSLEWIVRCLCERLGEEEVVNPDILLKANDLETSSCPQDKVIRWMTWSEDRSISVSDTDISFTLRELPRWGLQKRDYNRRKTNVFKADCSCIRSSAQFDTLSKLVPDLDNNTYLINDGEQIKLVINGEVEPYHLMILAVVDYVLEHNSEKTIAGLQQAIDKDVPLNTEAYMVNDETRVDIELENNIIINGIFDENTIDIIANSTLKATDLANKLFYSVGTINELISKASAKTGLTPTQLTILFYEIGMLNFDNQVEKIVNSDKTRRLTGRQAECLQLSSEGMTISEISDRIGVAQSTVNVYKSSASNVLGTTGIGYRLPALVAYARGEITLPKRVQEYMDEHGLKSATE